MAFISGFQSNTTIHAAFWIFKPDPLIDPRGREVMVEVNAIQYTEATQAHVISSSVTNVLLLNNVLTLTCDPGAAKLNGLVLFQKFTTATFLNGHIGRITKVTPTSITFAFNAANYPSAPEPAGAEVIDAGSRMIELYYAAGAVSTSQAPRKLEGPVAARFIYDMEGLFY